VRAFVSEWHGAYLVEDGAIVRAERAPLEAHDQGARARLRHGGLRTPEEERILGSRGEERWVTRDRRLVGPGVAYDRRAIGTVAGPEATAMRREYLLAEAEAALAAAWDPSIHVEEAVRAVRDLDRAANLVGERLSSWVSRDALDAMPVDAAGAARQLLEAEGDTTLGPADPALVEARRALAGLYRAIGTTREALEAAVAASVPSRTPNLSDLLGPELTASLLAQAGGLDRLARLPSSTVQVLGAERAFFAHLRGRAPPPRHGLLFLHPSIQSAPRKDRGKLARALAGKVAIAARRDAAGSAADPALRLAFERREAALRARRTGGAAKRSRPPLDRAADDR